MASPADTRVLLDVMCGGLTSILRMVGYDTVYALERDAEADEVLIELAETEERVIVTRDRAVAAAYEPSVLVEAKETDEQLRELSAAGFDLQLDEPERCSHCNGVLEVAEGDERPAHAPDSADLTVWRCRDCGHYYWKGSHWADVRARLETV